ncbi:MAG: IS200/IS605 family transposase [Ignavibacteria bacterium]|nr:IS200/IS605 family transposase [Ignavibacteria bacterium]
MSQVFYKTFYHIVWSTLSRQPIITPEIEKVLLPFFDNKTKRYSCSLYGIGGTENHIHIAILIPPAKSVSDIVGKLKGSSSYFLNKELQITKNFTWQDGFGVLSFAEKDLKNILRYIHNQKEHHKNGTLNEVMERIETDI